MVGKGFNISKMNKGEVNILIIPNIDYSAILRKLTADFATQYQVIIYVNLNKSFPSLLQFFEQNAINIEKFIIIDPITKSSELKGLNTDQLIHVSSISALTELSITINKVLDKTKADALILDSLSTLLIYNDESLITRFVHSLIGKVRRSGSTVVLPILQGDSKTNLIEDLSMFVDNIASLDGYKPKTIENGKK